MPRTGGAQVGGVQDRVGMLRESAHSSPTSLGALAWQGLCAMVGPQPCWCRQPCQGLLREEVPTVLLATVPIGPALLLWLCPGRWQGLAYSSCLPARE